MINYMERVETVISKELDKGNSDLIENSHPCSPDSAFRTKTKRKSNFKNRIPICNWTMPAQPEGYIRAVKYDLL